jgi:GxxExxY protein
MSSYAVRRLTAQQVSHAIITAAMRVHSELGPGLLESAYQVCLQCELREGGVRSEAQVMSSISKTGSSVSSMGLAGTNDKSSNHEGH